jgi:hypothetical protein
LQGRYTQPIEKRRHHQRRYGRCNPGNP